MVRIAFEDPLIGGFGAVILETTVSTGAVKNEGCKSYIFLLFVHMTDLKPYVFFSQWCRW